MQKDYNLLHVANATLPEALNSSTAAASTIASPITNDHWKLFVTLVAFSSLCLLVTLILYLLIWDTHNCQGWTQFSYLLALFLFDSVFIIALCPGLTSGNDRNTGCKVLSILNQYFFISAKTWLIIISLDLFSTIRKIRAVAGDYGRKNLYRFIIYASVAWCFPLVFVTVGIILNLQNPTDDDTSHFVSNDNNLWASFPDYGFQHCRIPNWAIWEYFVFGNCIFHLCMFALISITILYQRWKIASLANVRGVENNGNTNRQASPFLMLLKLFIVVGLSWSYIALQDLLKAGNINTKQNWAWHIFRCIFFLQGAFISAITLTNGKLASNLAKRHPYFKRLKTTPIYILSVVRQKLSLKARKESLQSCVSQKTMNSSIGS